LGYNNCRKDICGFFSRKTTAEIFEHPILIAPNNTIRLIKSRINNSNSKQGKSSGYRLYYYVNIEKDSVYLLGFYPKTGKYGKPDLTDTETKILLKEFNSEKESGSLIEHDLTEALKEIAPVRVAAVKQNSK
jgi:mRNA-degrading endonuclease RelE of RelBE toxin-antitoxin system